MTNAFNLDLVPDEPLTKEQDFLLDSKNATINAVAKYQRELHVALLNYVEEVTVWRNEEHRKSLKQGLDNAYQLDMICNKYFRQERSRLWKELMRYKKAMMEVQKNRDEMIRLFCTSNSQ